MLPDVASDQPLTVAAAGTAAGAGAAAAGGAGRRKILERAWRMRQFYLLLAPAGVLLIVFKYVPMYGAGIAFVDYNIVKGILGSTWNNFKWFEWVFTDPFFWRVLRNAVIISLLRLAFGFPAPILFALLLNEVGNTAFKRSVQSISYLPHFLSWIVLGGIIRELLSVQRGVVPYVMAAVGLEPINFLTNIPTFRALLVATGVWQSVGWGSIIYLAALSGIDPELYESATVDGANRLQMALRVTLPALTPVMTILFLLQLGNILEQGWDQIFNLYNDVVVSVSDVFETLVYRSGIEGAKYSYATAINLFQNVVGFALLIVSNQIVRRRSDYAIW